MDGAKGKELVVHLLFNRLVRGPAEPPLGAGMPVAAEIWSHLPCEGRVEVVLHRAVPRISLRLPDGADASGCRLRRGGKDLPAEMEGPYAIVPDAAAGERVDVTFPLKEYETVEAARDKTYRVGWKGSSVNRTPTAS